MRLLYLCHMSAISERNNQTIQFTCLAGLYNINSGLESFIGDLMAEVLHLQLKTIFYTFFRMQVCVDACVLLQHICCFFFFLSNFWLILSTSLHFLLRGAVQSSHVGRSCDKAGEKWGREEEEEKRRKGGREGKTGRRERESEK